MPDHKMATFYSGKNGSLSNRREHFLKSSRSSTAHTRPMLSPLGILARSHCFQNEDPELSTNAFKLPSRTQNIASTAFVNTPV
jgi:hypothetical protein